VIQGDKIKGALSEWLEKPLGQLVKFQKGRKVATSEYKQDGYEYYLGASSLGSDAEGYASTKMAVIANSGDVLMLWDGERSGLVGHNLSGVVSSTVSRITPSNEINCTYLYYYLLSRFEWIQGRRTGTGVPHVPKDLSRILRINYPANMDEQRRIAEMLASIDSVIKKTESLIAKYQKIKAGLMHDLFTRGVTADGKLRPPREQAPELYKETPIGWIPREWLVENLGRLSEIVSGVTLGAARSVMRGIVVPYLRVANVQDGYLDLSDVKTVNVTMQELDKLRLKEGDVLMNEGGDFDKLGRGTVWRGEIADCVHQNHVFRVRPVANKLRSDYLAYWSQSVYGKKYFILSSKQSTNLASINSTQLNRFPIAVPSFLEQRGMEARILSMVSEIDVNKDELRKLNAIKLGLMRDLLTGHVQVSGSLDVAVNI
jgi:type I restriction enzyme S subunit